MSYSLPQKVTSTGHSTTNKSEIENLTIADAAIPTIDSKTLDNIGNNLSSQGKYKLALTFYDRALAIDPYRFNAFINKAFTLDNLSRYNESLAYFDKVLTINPDEDIALNGKGEALLKLGNYDEAIPYFDKILDVNSSDSGLLVVASKNKQFALDALKNAENDVQ